MISLDNIMLKPASPMRGHRPMADSVCFEQSNQDTWASHHRRYRQYRHHHSIRGQHHSVGDFKSVDSKSSGCEEYSEETCSVITTSTECPASSKHLKVDTRSIYRSRSCSPSKSSPPSPIQLEEDYNNKDFHDDDMCKFPRRFNLRRRRELKAMMEARAKESHAWLRQIQDDAHRLAACRACAKIMIGKMDPDEVEGVYPMTTDRSQTASEINPEINVAPAAEADDVSLSLPPPVPQAPTEPRSSTSESSKPRRSFMSMRRLLPVPAGMKRSDSVESVASVDTIQWASVDYVHTKTHNPLSWKPDCLMVVNAEVSEDEGEGNFVHSHMTPSVVSSEAPIKAQHIEQDQEEQEECTRSKVDIKGKKPVYLVEQEVSPVIDDQEEQRNMINVILNAYANEGPSSSRTLLPEDFILPEPDDRFWYDCFSEAGQLVRRISTKSEPVPSKPPRYDSLDAILPPAAEYTHHSMYTPTTPSTPEETAMPPLPVWLTDPERPKSPPRKDSSPPKKPRSPPRKDSKYDSLSCSIVPRTGPEATLAEYRQWEKDHCKKVKAERVARAKTLSKLEKKTFTSSSSSSDKPPKSPSRFLSDPITWIFRRSTHSPSTSTSKTLPRRAYPAYILNHAEMGSPTANNGYDPIAQAARRRGSYIADSIIAKEQKKRRSGDPVDWGVTMEVKEFVKVVGEEEARGRRKGLGKVVRRMMSFGKMG
ncbi:uncharacterized protein SPPG_02407 [Spizellomyces punctatus DAOM BR117]|uniref:Uncharacterized protein n=1 Tax=Spizellomyces punctatus (strain DAOM BR117) TaxID=645134 RepID=A0A0L0HR67_SPIPD|nr:uncharacterized protein SPPG_02407 [Spizellomyces punctatus DAOM BR117]KND03364.1 hypothetical protein SPPG_02407 [Spizellomyces punctatus DAOM BR117]|eukprot:XP_016611403.1 hypothetical protein SPPG_02407 [Spizellomyces punctatus DAOM BR117]